HGNVWQWCADAGGNPGPVNRGGGWINVGSGCQAAYRRWGAPTGRDVILGFRLARVPRPVAGQAGRREPPRSPERSAAGGGGARDPGAGQGPNRKNWSNRSIDWSSY